MRLLAAFILLILGIPVPAQAQLGSGVGPPPTPAQLQQRCDGGNALDCGDLGARLAKGEGVAKDPQRAAALFLRGCDGGDGFSCFQLGFVYLNGEGVAKDPKKESAYFLRGCDGGVDESCAQMAFNYNNGIGVKQDDAKVALYADRSCGNSPIGCALLGVVYEQGFEGYPKNLGKAVELYRFACNARRPNEAACTKLDKLGYAQQEAKPAPSALADQTGAQGQVASVSPETTAARVAPVQRSPQAPAMEAACDRGEARSCTDLGLDFENANGVQRDRVRARSLFSKGCDGGDIAGCTNLASKFQNGFGVARDYSMASLLYDKACRLGHRESCTSSSNLARLSRETPSRAVVKANPAPPSAPFAVKQALAVVQPGQGGAHSNATEPEFMRAIAGNNCKYADDVMCWAVAQKYVQGEDFEKKFQKQPQISVRLLSYLCTKGYKRGCGSLGMLTLQGGGTQKNEQEALRLFKIGCDDRDPDSCALLSSMYANGIAVPQNKIQALMIIMEGLKYDPNSPTLRESLRLLKGG